MRTDRRLLLGFSIAVAALSVSALAVLSAPVDAAVVLAEDSARLGLELKSSTNSTGFGADKALDRAREEVPHILASARSPRGLTARVEVRMSPTDAAMDVWMVRFDEFSYFFPGPVNADGSRAPGHTAHYAYVFLDPHTSELMYTMYTE